MGALLRDFQSAIDVLRKRIDEKHTRSLARQCAHARLSECCFWLTEATIKDFVVQVPTENLLEWIKASYKDSRSKSIAITKFEEYLFWTKLDPYDTSELI